MLNYKLLFLISRGQNSLLLLQRNLIGELYFHSKPIQECIGTGETLFSPDLLLPCSCYKESVFALHSYAASGGETHQPKWRWVGVYAFP